jgi:hypothetical protein
MVLTFEGRVTAWSAAAVNVFGHPAEHAVGSDIRSLLAGPAAADTIEHALRAAAEGRAWSGALCTGESEVTLVCEPLAGVAGGTFAVITALPRCGEAVELMDEAGRRIGSTLDLGQTAREVVEVMVPRFADAGGVLVLERLLADEDWPGIEADGSVVVRRLAVALAPDDPLEWAETFPVDEVVVYGPSTPFARCVREGEATLCSVGDGRSTRELSPRETPDQASRHVSILTVPLVTRGRVLGFCLFSRKRGRPSFSARDVAVASELAARAATCIDNARLYQRENHIAALLQYSLLPTRVTPPAGLEIAHRYLPAGDVTRVGGDWYDVIRLPGDQVAVVIGDAMGHGVAAAAAMGQLRVAAHTLASLSLRPAEVLRRLDTIAQGLDAAQFATCICIVCDPVTRVCEIAAAGHPPPLLALPDGATRVLHQPPGLPLGVGDACFQSTRVILPAGGTLILYTDGLVENRHLDLDSGIAALRSTLALPYSSLEATADALLEGHGWQQGRDDIALLLLRPCPAAAGEDDGR